MNLSRFVFNAYDLKEENCFDIKRYFARYI